METSDGEIKLHSELREISVCEAVDNEKSSVPSLGRENNETRNSQDTIGNKQNIDNFSFKNDKHVCDNTKHELNPIFERHSEDVNKKNTNQMRAKINLRERKRMHDLNLAMEGLREVMPCANGPSMRKLSKIATLSLARNYIQMLTRSIEELKIMLDDAYHSQFHGPTIARRRNDVTVHPYRQLVGIRHSNISSGIASNLDSSYSPGFERYTNFQRSVISNMSTCASHGCCFRNNDAGIPRGLYHTSWNEKMP